MKNAIISLLIILSAFLYYQNTRINAELEQSRKTLVQIQNTSKQTELRLNAELAKNRQENEIRTKEYNRIRELVAGVADAKEPASYHLRLIIEELSQ